MDAFSIINISQFLDQILGEIKLNTNLLKNLKFNLKIKTFKYEIKQI